MSRHRDVRCMNYSDEYDNYDDVYGHSVEDDYCVSPSAQQFMFDRNKQPNISSFFTEPDIVEDNEEVESVTADSKLPKMSELDTAKLISCTEAVKNIIGDKCLESELHKKIIEFNFNTEAVLNSILNNEPIKNEYDDQSLDTDMQTQSDPKSKDSLIDSQLTKKITKEPSSLSDLIAQSSKSKESNSFSSLSDLTAHHLNRSDKKSNSEGFNIPKMTFDRNKSSSFNKNPILNDHATNFNEIANLAANHLKISTEKMNKALENTDIPFDTNNLNLDSKNKSIETIKPSFNSLADLSAHHLKVLSENTDAKKNKDSPTQFIIPKISTKINKLDKYNISSFAPFGSVDTSIKQYQDSYLSSKFIVDDPSTNIKQERLSNDISQDISKLILEDISNLNYEKIPVPENIMETEVNYYDINLYDKLSIKKEKSKELVHKQINCDNESNTLLNSTIKAIREKCQSNNESTYSVKLLRKTVSSFGKVLCKRHGRKAPYKRKNMTINTEEDSDILLRFNFSLPSPDDKILEKLKYRMVDTSVNKMGHNSSTILNTFKL